MASFFGMWTEFEELINRQLQISISAVENKLDIVRLDLYDRVTNVIYALTMWYILYGLGFGICLAIYRDKCIGLIADSMDTDRMKYLVNQHGNLVLGVASGYVWCVCCIYIYMVSLLFNAVKQKSFEKCKKWFSIAIVLWTFGCFSMCQKFFKARNFVLPIFMFDTVLNTYCIYTVWELLKEMALENNQQHVVSQSTAKSATMKEQEKDDTIYVWEEDIAGSREAVAQQQRQGMDPAENTVLTSCEIKELGDTNEIKNLLECPICMGVPIPPIWSCVSGHIVCAMCKNQMQRCGLCRMPFTGSRNLFMEAVVSECLLVCPHADKGCKEIFKLDFMKTHAVQCRFGPKIKWIASQGGQFPENAVKGGHQHGVSLYIMRSTHNGSTTPGKIFEFNQPGLRDSISKASLAWGGGERFKNTYEVLVAPPEQVTWVQSHGGVFVQNAIIGGTSETGETLYIGRFHQDGHLINGKVQLSHKCCYIGVYGKEIASMDYEVLVNIPRNDNRSIENETDDQGGASHSYFS